MSRYKDSNKYKIYGEDAILAARFDKYLDATLRNCRADYLKALSKRKQREIPYEDLPDVEKETVQESSAADDEIESLLFWEVLKTHLHLILSTNKQNVTDARSRLRQVQGNLLAELSNLGCTIKPMTNNERLEVLHNFFRRGEEGRFQFSFDDYGKLGNDFRNTIAPDVMRCTTKYTEIDDGFAKAMTIAQYPQQLSDNFVATLLQQVPYIVLSIDITPVETEDAMREIEASQMKIDSEKYRANRRNVENLDFMATISPRNQQQEKYTAEIRNAICEGDQQVFMVLLSVAYFADTLEEIRQETDALQSAAANFNCRFTEMRFQQENCFNTAMPYGLRRVESSHMMLTRSVTALVPFVAQEVQSPQGIFYGRNAITGNLIVGDRTKLINGNAMVIATSGSGKSMSV